MADSKPKREAKVVERLDIGEVKAKEEFKVVAGKGTRLGDIENVEFRIGKALSSADEVKKLHRLCYGSEGQKTVVKKHLREFSGFPESQAEKKKEQIIKMDGGLIKKIMMMCDIPTTGTKVSEWSRVVAMRACCKERAGQVVRSRVLVRGPLVPLGWMRRPITPRTSPSGSTRRRRQATTDTGRLPLPLDERDDSKCSRDSRRP